MKINKYRCWDVENQEMRGVDNIMFEDDNAYIRCDMYSDYFTEEEMIPTMSTGIPDITGKEIYEGDIVELYCVRHYCNRQISKHDIPTKVRAVVVYGRSAWGYALGFRLDYKNNFNKKICEAKGKEQEERSLWERTICDFIYNESHKPETHPKLIWRNHIKVIGNIYANPELLEVEKCGEIEEN